MNMKQRFSIIRGTKNILGVGIGLLLTASNVAMGAATNAPAASEPAAPVRSLFQFPTGPQDGKDPFFPRSSRPWSSVNPSTKTGPTAPVVELFLNGISGTDEKPLCVINNVTFGPSDDRDVFINGRRIRIRCIEINRAEGRVVVQIGSEQRVLRLPVNK